MSMEISAVTRSAQISQNSRSSPFFSSIALCESARTRIVVATTPR